MRYYKIVILTLLLVFAFVGSAYAGPRWSKDRVREEVDEALKYYDMHPSSTNRSWLKSSAVDIIFELSGKPAHESNGAWYAGASNGTRGCEGILQFSTSWHQSDRDRARAKKYNHSHYKGDWRYCAHCSIYRYVRAYRDGGRRTIESAWKATLYR